MSQPRVGESSNSFNNFFNTVGNFGNADERAEILAWLSPLEPEIRHHDIRAHRVGHVGDWLLQTEEYQGWLDGIRGGEPDNSALFCYGYPGVGKTYISSLVIDKLCDRAREKNAAVAWFYLDFAAKKDQSPTRILSSLLKQVVGGLEKVPAKIVQAFRDQENTIGGRKLRLSEIVEMLQDISSSRPTFICIDAVDECVARHREKLLDSLRQILHKSPSARIFLTARLHVRDEVEKHLVGRVVALSVTPTRDDIIRFLRAKLREDEIQDAMDKSLEEDIIKSIPEAISEIFLLVSLKTNAILEETTLHRRREKLSKMANCLGLAGVYDVAIGQIKAQEWDRERLGMATLMWILHSERPLNVDEICHALAVEIGSTDINTNNVPSIRTVLACCQGLVAVDKGSSTIRLIHFTLKEYLSDHGDLFDRAHSKIAETCLTYLNFQAIKELSASPSCGPRGAPFLGYSSLYWGTHMRMELSECSRHLALNLLDRYNNHISAELLWKSTIKWYLNSGRPFSALHCISYFGIVEVTTDLIRAKRWDVNQRDSAGLTPLMWAARYGNEGVVKLLLQQKQTQPDIPDARYGRTALSWAAWGGHEGVVGLFLGPLFVNPGSMGRRWGKTPQMMSVLFGRKYVNPDRPDNTGQTPLSQAAENGHDGVVELLLGRGDVNPDKPGDYGRTPLSWAAENGHKGVVELLLGQGDVYPDIPDDFGSTPLSLAAKNGHEGVVELLLGQGDASPDRPDNDAQTPLLWAARNGRDGVVKLLLEREDVSLDRPDNDGQTPLSWAARNGHEGVVRLLLVREDVSLDRPDNDGQTPLSWAARNGHDGVLKLFLGGEDVTPGRPDNYGRTPLSLAARNGRYGAVKLLLEREDVCPERPDHQGRTPLSWACRNGHEGVVRQLLEREDVSPDRPETLGRTPLSLATLFGHWGVVDLLWARKAATPSVVRGLEIRPLLASRAYPCTPFS